MWKCQRFERNEQKRSQAADDSWLYINKNLEKLENGENWIIFMTLRIRFVTFLGVKTLAVFGFLYKSHLFISPVHHDWS